MPSWLAPTSYLGLFAAVILTGLGLPMPEDAVVLAGGYLVHRGATQLAPTMAVALVGVLVGDVALYLLGRRLGPRVLAHRRLARILSPERSERARRFFLRWGAGAVLAGRFVMGLRAAVFLTAGTLGMSFGRFLAIDFVGALVSVPPLVWLGAWGGANAARIAARVTGARWIALGACAGLVAVVLVVRRLRRRRRGASGASGGEGK